MMDRKRQQEQLANKIRSSPHKLTMNQGDGFRGIQEQRSAFCPYLGWVCLEWRVFSGGEQKGAISPNMAIVTDHYGNCLL